MEFDSLPTELNFDPAQFGEPIEIGAELRGESGGTFIGEPTSQILACVAEQTIVQTILQGSSCEEEEELNLSALRFVRYLLTWSKAARHGFLPNFANNESIRLLAREFIQSSGGGGPAIRRMLDSMEAA